MTIDYNKPPLTYMQQIILLQSRGLEVADTTAAIKFFQQVNYYRLSAYCIPFQPTRDVFATGTKFEIIVELYRLDELLRNDYLALLSPIEVFLRTGIVYELSHGWDLLRIMINPYFVMILITQVGLFHWKRK